MAVALPLYDWVAGMWARKWCDRALHGPTAGTEVPGLTPQKNLQPVRRIVEFLQVASPKNPAFFASDTVPVRALIEGDLS